MPALGAHERGGGVEQHGAGQPGERLGGARGTRAPPGETPTRRPPRARSGRRRPEVGRSDGSRLQLAPGACLRPEASAQSRDMRGGDTACTPPERVTVAGGARAFTTLPGDEGPPHRRRRLRGRARRVGLRDRRRRRRRSARPGPIQTTSAPWRSRASPARRTCRARLVGEKSIQVDGPNAPRVEFFVSSGEAEARQFQGEGQGAEQVGAALLFVNEGDDDVLRKVEDCLAKQ